MNEVTFKVYYQFNGPTKDNPFIEKKTNDDITESLDRIEDELPVIIDDSNAVITVERQPATAQEVSDIRQLTVISSLSKDDIAHAVKRTLDGLGLYYSLL